MKKEKNKPSKQDEIKKQVEKEEKEKRKKENREYYIVGYLFIALFIGLIGYFSYFIAYGRDEVINSSLNNRVKDMSKNVIRGSILAGDGSVLAKSEENVDGSLTRVYPFGSLFAHTVGYSTKGTTGIENQKNSLLMQADVGLRDQIVNDIFQNKVKGNNVITTLDVGLQKFCYDALGDRKGAVVVMESATGKILAMVSRPDFDPNHLDELWPSLSSEDNTDANLVNRAAQGHYPPGSTFKMLTALEYIREHPEDWQNFSYECNGTLNYNGLALNCHEGHAHGVVDLKGAMSLSCNGAFATMGLSLDRNKFTKLCEDFGFNQPLDLDMLYKKSSFQFNKDSSDWDIMQTSIGQGKTMTSPLHLAMITSVIANGGSEVKPYLIDRVQTEEGNIIEQYSPKPGKKLMEESEVKELTQFLISVVKDGSGYRAGSQYAQVAGKTGSAEYNSTGGMHAWFTGFAPAENPEITVTLVLEGGGTGGDNAAPVVGSIFDHYFSTKQ